MKDSAYKKAGVDVAAGEALVEAIKPCIKATNRSGVMGGIGGFGALFDPKAAGYEDPILVSGTDSVGTKLKIAIETGIHDTIGIDAVAMCVNDVLVQGAEPLFFLDYFASGTLEPNTVKTVISSVAKGCTESGCALIGGEMAEMPGLYAKGDYDLVGFCVGAANRDSLITGQDIKEGDVIIGLASNGVHSNGFSLVRKIVKDLGLSYNSPAPFEENKTIGQALLTPTRLYVKPVLTALKKYGASITGMSHITGGGITGNISRVVPKGLSAVINQNSWPRQEVFKWLQSKGGISNNDMLSTLNCGIGFALVVEKNAADGIFETLTKAGEKVYKIGEITKGAQRVCIK